jgi:hypothetical protein
MTTTATNKLRACITAEWHDHRLGVTAFGAMVQILKAAGATDITAPSMGWLTFVPCEEGFEGTLEFAFAHNLSWEEGETAPVLKALREVVRVKALDWDLDAIPEDYDYNDHD